MWNVTLLEAIDWCEYNVKRRYEWAEMLAKMFGGETAENKFCRACKAAKKNKNCKQCDRKIKVVK